MFLFFLEFLIWWYLLVNVLPIQLCLVWRQYFKGIFWAHCITFRPICTIVLPWTHKVHLAHRAGDVEVLTMTNGFISNFCCDVAPGYQTWMQVSDHCRSVCVCVCRSVLCFQEGCAQRVPVDLWWAVNIVWNFITQAHV